ncbi:MAG TPA: hypothetical protein VFO85_17235, partial [Vicinamibacteria bacterium]|nr:hypothetical protein [Vicinamibacteria bacterium]
RMRAARERSAIMEPRMLAPRRSGCQMAAGRERPYTGRVRRSGPGAAVVLAILLAPALARAEDTLTRPRMRTLDLGLYGRVHPASQALQMPRFESSIEVVAEKPHDANTAMAAHWRQWDLSTGSIYGKGINFTNQGCATCVNILPLLGKLVDAVKK